MTWFLVCLYPDAAPALCEAGVYFNEGYAYSDCAKFNSIALANNWASDYEIRTSIKGVTIDADVLSSLTNEALKELDQ